VDMLRGMGPGMLAVRMGCPSWTVVAGGLAAIAGHNWSVFLKFQGGKGIATSFGVLLALSWPAAAVAGAVWVVAVAITRYSSLGSLLAVVSVPLSLRWLRQPDAYVYLYRHRVVAW